MFYPPGKAFEQLPISYINGEHVSPLNAQCKRTQYENMCKALYLTQSRKIQEKTAFTFNVNLFCALSS